MPAHLMNGRQEPDAALDSPAPFERAKRIAARHCDPRHGAPYWIGRARSLGIDVERDVQAWPDLLRFGWMDEEALRTRPIDDFIPSAVKVGGDKLVLAETSGFMGDPKTAAYTESEFAEAFIRPFQIVADAVGFPDAGRWLWIGPSGPHPIGLASRAIARLQGWGDPFSVDFDPRWFNKLAPGSFARERYLEHLLEQSLLILRREPIDVLFATPSVLERLAERMTGAMRERIRGIHYGGQPLGEARFRALKDVHFPNAVHLGGYGNSLFGVCMQLPLGCAAEPHYLPHGSRMKIAVVDPSAHASSAPSDFSEVAPGERGRVVVSRFDETMMILNLLERDEATRVQPDSEWRARGFTGDGVGRPELAARLRERRTEGIY